MCGNCAGTTAEEPQQAPIRIAWILCNDRGLSATVGPCGELQRTTNPKVRGSIPLGRTNRISRDTQPGTTPAVPVLCFLVSANFGDEATPGGSSTACADRSSWA